jgi:hypothetical protein
MCHREEVRRGDLMFLSLFILFCDVNHGHCEQSAAISCSRLVAAQIATSCLLAMTKLILKKCFETEKFYFKTPLFH